MNMRMTCQSPKPRGRINYFRGGNLIFGQSVVRRIVLYNNILLIPREKDLAESGRSRMFGIVE